MSVYRRFPVVKILWLIAISMVGLSLFAIPNSAAQGTIPPGTVAIYLPMITHMVPTATPIPTAPPTPVTPQPTMTPQANYFNIVVVSHCLPQAAGNWFEGTTYVGGEPQNGYKVVFSYAPDGPPVTEPVISGPHTGYPGWRTGYYSHIIHAHGPEVGDWYVWIIDDAGERISEIGHWHSTGADNTCNQAVVDFDSR
ncbi:MAG: hypothetical protein NT075_07470 [Chloroflexi bacterium]|nr:hypothetical protein [Chloroflexota bacterium]